MEHPEDTADDAPKTNAELREVAVGRMIQTAIRLIARDGPSKLSMVDVGRESGYSHSLPNYYFKTKQKLVLEVYVFIVNRFRKRSLPGRARTSATASPPAWKTSTRRSAPTWRWWAPILSGHAR